MKSKNEKQLRPVHPNASILQKYRRQLLRLSDAMFASYRRWILAAWRANPPALAADAADDDFPEAPAFAFGRSVHPEGFTGLVTGFNANITRGITIDPRNIAVALKGELLLGANGLPRRFASREAAAKALRQAMTPAPQTLQIALSNLRAHWEANFDSAAEKLATHFAKDVAERSDAALRAALRKGGFSVRFQMTDGMREAAQAIVQENVSLIRSIASEFHTEVEGLVMRSVARGRDIAYLTEELEHRFGITRRRAEGIAIDQNNKSTNALARTRAVERGLDEAIWMHSGAGKKPRPTHKKNHGKRFSLRTGWYDPAVKKHILTGELPRCRCTFRVVMKGLS